MRIERVLRIKRASGRMLVTDEFPSSLGITNYKTEECVLNLLTCQDLKDPNF